MDKREQIERAFAAYIEKRDFYDGVDIDFAALAEQAIVIECEVGQIPYDGEGGKQFWETAIMPEDMDADGYIQYPDKRGTPGKALAIIVPLEE